MPAPTTTMQSSGGGSVFSRRSTLFGQRGRERPNTPAGLPTASTFDTIEETTDSSYRPPPTKNRHRRESSLHSLSSAVTDLGTAMRRSVSLRSESETTKNKSPPAPAARRSPTAGSPKKRSASSSAAHKSSLALSGFSFRRKPSEPPLPNGPYSNNALAASTSKTNVAGLGAPFGYNKEDMPRPPATSHSSGTFGSTGTVPTLQGPGNLQNPMTVYQHVHEMSSKRISSLDYLRKAHEGRIYWFNTLHFSKTNISRLSYYEPRKLARRACNFLLLGYSIPTLLDLNSQTALEYLRALVALLTEFEAYQTLHNPDHTSGSSSLSRARIPQMFKRAGGKSRRISAAASTFASSAQNSTGSDNASPVPSAINTGDSPSLGGDTLTPVTSYTTSPPTIPTSDAPPSLPDAINPGESYTHLLIAPLPFDPDFFETFATLCDCLIDCYTKIMSLLATPEAVLAAPGVGDLFQKADGKIRKVIIAGVVRDFEDASRQGARAEVQGVGKVVLGGLM